MIIETTAAITLKASPIMFPHCCFNMSKTTHDRNDEPNIILNPIVLGCMKETVFKIAAKSGNAKNNSIVLPV